MRKIISLALGIVLLLAFAGCDKTEPEPGAVTLFTTSALDKVHRDISFEGDTSNLKYEVKAMKGEYESGQIIIHPEQDVKEYQIVLADLTSAAGKSFSKQNFAVYNQKYIEIVTSTNLKPQVLDLGFLPDALLPFDKAVEYKENTVKGGEYQGIWIETFVPFEQEAGIYTGNFTVQIDGQDYTVPAQVTVWDYAISKYTHSQSSFQINGFYMPFGELSATPDLRQKYEEAQIKYRIAPHMFTLKDGESKADWIRHYFDHDNKELTSYLSTILLSISLGSDGKSINRTGFYDEVKWLAQISAEDNINYMAFAAVRSGLIDEPNQSGKWEEANGVSKDFNLAREEIADQIALDAASNPNSPYKSDITDQIVSSIRQINNYVTNRADNRLPDVTNYALPAMGASAYERDIYQVSGERQWWYPLHHTTPGYQIDGYTLDHRVSNWMMYDYGFVGELYWCTTLYAERTGSNTFDLIDPYNHPMRSGIDNGDGYLFYPGTAYGIDGPVPSIRLMAIRDGKEDYEYLYELGRLYQNAGYDATAILNRLYPLIYSETNVINDTQMFGAARQAVMDLIFLAADGIFVTDFSVIGKDITVGIALDGDDYIAGFNGEAAVSTQTTFTADYSAVSALDFTSGNGIKLHIPLGGRAQVINDFGSLDKVSIDAEVGSISLDTDLTDSALKAEFNAEAQLKRLKIQGMTLNRNTAAVTFRIYNPDLDDNNRNFVNFVLSGSGGTSTFRDYRLAPGWNEINVTGFINANWSMVRNFDGIILEFVNRSGQELDYVVIDDLCVITR